MIAAIHGAARGYPRAINNLAAALIATYAAEKSIVDLTAAQCAITGVANSTPSRATTTTSP
ncbi:hypothetical protein [Microbacterium sp.]|uniref:hypothetical protein n=1 Tax=Microbacterium sp. TaxID=51671 RepID=UPI0037CAC27D